LVDDKKEPKIKVRLHVHKLEDIKKEATEKNPNQEKEAEEKINQRIKKLMEKTGLTEEEVKKTLDAIKKQGGEKRKASEVGNPGAKKIN